MRLYQALTVFDLKATSSKEDVKKRYRELIKKHHPDKHPKNEESQRLATEKFCTITEAYRTIEAFLLREFSPPPQRAPAQEERPRQQRPPQQHQPRDQRKRKFYATEEEILQIENQRAAKKFKANL